VRVEKEFTEHVRILQFGYRAMAIARRYPKLEFMRALSFEGSLILTSPCSFAEIITYAGTH
jgi:hypothetical protein